MLFGVARARMIGARSLDRALDSLGARIGQKDRVGKGVLDEPRGIGLALRAAIEVRYVHQRRRLLLDRLRQLRVAVPEQVDRDAARTVEITFASLAAQLRALAAPRTHSTPGVYGHPRRAHLGRPLQVDPHG